MGHTVKASWPNPAPLPQPRGCECPACSIARRVPDRRTQRSSERHGSNARRAFAVLAAGLALVLALPGLTLAAVNVSTPESATVTASISATFPASLAYAGAGPMTATASVTNLLTNNPTGLTVNVSGTDLAAGALTIVANKRTWASPTITGGATDCSGTGKTFPNTQKASAGGTVVAGTQYPMVWSTVANLNGTACGFDLGLSLNITGAIPGAYTGTLSWSASTN